jgi:hypothetical protein
MRYRIENRKLVLLLVASMLGSLGATTYYVAKTGNDGNPGTEGSPLLTIQAGVNRASAGDVIMVLAGTYNEQVSFPRSGTEGLPITVQGAARGGNPLVTVTSADSVTATWLQAPEVGSGVYKAALGFAPTEMYVDSERILRISDALMAGDSSSGYGVWPGTGLHMLAFAENKTWYHPFSTSSQPSWWDAVGAAFGSLGGTTYIRFRDGDDPNGKRLYSNSGYPMDFYINKDYVTLKHLRICGAPYAVLVDGAHHCVIESCAVRHGYCRIALNYGGDNAVRGCDLSLGGYSSVFREWTNADNDSIWGDAALAVESYCFRKWMNGDLGGVQVVEEDGDEISGCDIHHTHVGICLRDNATNSRVFDNRISYTSSAGIERQFSLRHDSTLIYANDFAHCAISFRPSAIGYAGDTCRKVYFYNNRSYQDDGLGNHFLIHEAADYDYYIQSGDANSPEIWLYHNSFAGGSYWANPAKYACDSMRLVNNIISSHYLMADVIALEMTDSSLLRAFDYNFVGGGFRYYGGPAWAARDRHNLWPTDSVHGNVNHQVWPLGSEPDWVVRDTSPAYRVGLDLSHPFTLRGTTYGPLPGMTPGYFSGAKPDLGTVQDTGYAGVQYGDPGDGNVSRLPELAFAPNPATSRDVTVRCAIPTGKVGRFVVRDVLGRTVKSIALVTSGVSRLDLRNLAPGIYIAALDAGGPPVSRKLIITAH